MTMKRDFEVISLTVVHVWEIRRERGFGKGKSWTPN